ncbi:TPA: hypothetical protein ACMWN4_001657 [Clostridioides difficile]|nr:hypothetical protein [Clostridioides difficile]MCW0877913.1 hypothetical protein [Clostridioides difficile]MDE3719296.1 hypothetical protein [Clostridioides difficile]MDS6447054.1 hypothetical protein [Clostridioides difficile]HCQ6016764.1 hypothetical protein [Clostridioides difficile]
MLLKKHIFKVKLVMLSLFFLFICTVKIEAYRDNEIDNLKPHYNQIEELEYNYESMIEVDSDNNEKVLKLYKYMSLIPNNVINEFAETGGKIVLTHESLQDRFISEYALAGVYFDKTIYLSDKENWSEQSLIHEMGHFISDLYNDTSDSIFLDIYANEKNYLKLNSDNIDYYIKNPDEYFAQCFEEFIINPDRLLKNNLRTYKYIRFCINRV